MLRRRREERAGGGAAGQARFVNKKKKRKKVGETKNLFLLTVTTLSSSLPSLLPVASLSLLALLSPSQISALPIRLSV